MLYERWREVVREWSSEVALSDAASGRCWTFSELFMEGEKGDVPSGSILFPQGNSTEFILTVLRAWRAGKIICPLEAGQEPPVFPQPPPECVHLKLTSGSTGNARGVAFTAEQLAADAGNIVKTMGLRRDWPNVGVISLAHSYGFSNLVLPLLLHGVPLILAPSPLPEIVRRAMANATDVTLAAVPALWRIWHDADAVSSKVRLAISAGAPLPIILESAVFERFGLKVHNFYGSSECGGIAYDRSELPRTDSTYVGEPMENVSVSIGSTGCLEVRSAAVGLTYWPEPGDALGNGVFQTSDLAEIRSGGICLRGRATDQINVAGRKFSPEIVEQVLMRHPAVRECLVFGVPCPEVERVETVVACVSARHEVKAEELRQFLLHDLPAWQVPREWWFVDEMETNRRGKFSRAEWKQRYLNRTRG